MRKRMNFEALVTRVNKRGARSPEGRKMLSLRDPGASVTIFVLCSCVIFSLPDYTQAHTKFNSQFGRGRPVTTPASPPDDLLLLYQIDRDIRSYSYKDVIDILSYEDDTLPYALAEKLGQNNKHSIRVIKENLKKVKSYLEREKEKKKPPTYDHMLKGVGVLLPLVLVLAFMYCVCIQFGKTKVCNGVINLLW